MKTNKIQKIDKEISCLEQKIKEIHAKISELKNKRKEEENLMIIQTVKKADLSVEQLQEAASLYKSMKTDEADLDETKSFNNQSTGVKSSQHTERDVNR